MTREERLNLLKQIEKDIHVCSLESTFLDDAKSCAIRSVIDELEQEPCEDCCNGNQIEKAKLCQRSYLAGMEHKQEPKTVIYSGDGYADGYMVYDMAECPNCGYEYEDGDKDWGENFCPHCGQPLEWEKEVEQ